MNDQGTQILDTQSLNDSMQDIEFEDTLPPAWGKLLPLNPAFKEHG